YVRLTELIPEILELVAQRKIAWNPAVSISFLAPKQQKLLYGVMTTLKTTPSIAQAKSIRQKAAEADFSETCLIGILSDKKPDQRPSQVPSAVVQEAEIKRYLPAHYNMEQMHNTILLLVRNWSKKRGYTK